MTAIKPPTCGEGSPKCGAFLAPGFNPLRFCRDHLARYRKASGSDVVVGDAGPVIDGWPNKYTRAEVAR